MAKRARLVEISSLQLERFAGPLYAKVYESLREQILHGQLLTGRPLPSSRVLATLLGVSRNTVLSAYDKLADEGYTVAMVGSGTRVRSTRPCLKPAAGNLIPGATIRRMLAEMFYRSRYPLRHAAFHDRDGNSLYIYDAGEFS